MYIKCATDYLDISAEKYPDKVGFVDAKRSVTFYEFQNEAKMIASCIIRQNVYKQPIAIYLDKSIECLTSAFGVMYSGNFYTPLDTGMPLARVQKICDVLQPAYIITDKKHLSAIEGLGVPALVYEEILDSKTADELLIRKKVSQIIDSDVAYILFTSGSTGVPKGVINSHKNIITYMQWSKEAFDFSEKTVFGSQTPFYFSMSVLDIFQTVCSSATLVIIPKKLFSFPSELIGYLCENGVNTIYWVPSALCQIANMGALGDERLGIVKKVLFAGEVMPTKQLNMWIKAFPDNMYANLFGPTEVTDICTYYIVDRELKNDESVPIGKVCDNMDAFILNEKGELVSGEEIGELCVRGSSVAYGYYNSPEKTNEAFVQNPLNSAYAELIYRTGDLVHYNANGELIYVSRKDFQIKHMGYRIELGEIETAASAVDKIERVCCTYDIKDSLIILFYTGDVEPDTLKREVKKKVPRYMIPNKIFQLEEMPLNLNGKIDRGLLMKNAIAGGDK